MSLATYAPAAGDSDDRGLAAFLESVPAAADYDLDELTPEGPVRAHRPHRRAAKQADIERSQREG